jgi:hypothetical protein
MDLGLLLGPGAWGLGLGLGLPSSFFLVPCSLFLGLGLGAWQLGARGLGLLVSCLNLLGLPCDLGVGSARMPYTYTRSQMPPDDSRWHMPDARYQMPPDGICICHMAYGCCIMTTASASFIPMLLRSAFRVLRCALGGSGSSY